MEREPSVSITKSIEISKIGEFVIPSEAKESLNSFASKGLYARGASSTSSPSKGGLLALLLAMT